MCCKKIILILIIAFNCTVIYSQRSGHLKFGLLHFEMLDSLADPEMKNLMEKRFERSLNYDIYFNQDTLLEIRNKEELNIRYMTFYDSQVPNVVLFFLSTPDGNYFSRDSTFNMVKKNHYTKKDEKAMKKMMIVGDPEKDNKTIVGFECKKVTMLNPLDRKSEYISTYLTSEIPTYTSPSNPFSILFPGFPLETTMVLDDFKVRYGAISYQPLDKQENIFDITTQDYSQISYDRMQELVVTYIELQ